MKVIEEKYWLRYWFIRYSSSSLIAIILFLLGIKMKVLEPSGSNWILFLVISSVMGMWFFFRFFSVLTMNSLVNKVYMGEITYDELFSYKVSKQRIIQVILFTLSCTVLLIVLNNIFIIQHEIIALVFFIFQSLGALLLSYQRASKKIHLAKTAEAIEKARFLTNHLSVFENGMEGTE